MKDWTYSINGIDGPYVGDFADCASAIKAAVRQAGTLAIPNTTPYGDHLVFVAKGRPPRVDFSGVDLLEYLAVWVEEDFGGVAAENWPAFTASEEQKADLTRAIEAAFVAWLERHNMVPDWRVVENPERLTLGAAREMVTKSAS